MSILRILLSIAFTVVMLDVTLADAADRPSVQMKLNDARSIDRGRYVARIAGCNDCHTAGYAESGGNVPEKDWLKGDQLGWRGPWGTTYPRNLRMFMSGLTEDQWVHTAQTVRLRPPMPWFALRDMSESDLRALYRFVRQLGPLGEQAPEYVPPDREPLGPVVQFPAPPK